MGNWGNNGELRIELEPREHCIIDKEAKRDEVLRPAHSPTEALPSQPFPR